MLKKFDLQSILVSGAASLFTNNVYKKFMYRIYNSTVAAKT